MPGSDPQGLLSYCSSKSIMPQAYSPLGGDAHAALLGAPEVKAIAAAHNATVGQVCVAAPVYHWHPFLFDWTLAL